MNFKEERVKLITVIIVYILVCVMGIGSFITAYHEVANGKELAENLNILGETFNNWGSYVFKIPTILQTVFSGGQTQNIFLFCCAALLVVFIYLYVKLLMNTRKKHDYMGEEHGSSAWSKNGRI